MKWKFDYMSREEFRILVDKFQLDEERVLEWLE